MTGMTARRRTRARLGHAIAALATIAALAGCDRTPRLVPPGADSTTAAIPADSTAVYIQMARDRWDTPDQGDEAARLVARVLLQDLRAHPGESPAPRARDLVDSLGMGAEVSGRGPAAVVNLFARANPSGGSWPWLFWRDGGATRGQALEPGGMHLVGVAVEPPDPAAGPRASRIAALFSRAGAGGQQPFAFVWQRPPDGAAWNLAQSLGGDSLGRVGTARVLQGGPEGTVLESRTYTIARGFDECASCAHVYVMRRFRWGTPGLVSASADIERTPYYSFIQLIQALVAGDPDGAQRWAADGSVVSAAEGYEWGRSRGMWRLAPGNAPSARDLVMFRASQEAYRVHFATRGDEWVVTGFEPTSRSVE